MKFLINLGGLSIWNNKNDFYLFYQTPTLFSPLTAENRKKTMKNNLNDHQNPLLNLAGKGLKYFLLTLFGLTIALVVFHLFGAISITDILLHSQLGEWVLKIAILLFCLFAIAMIFESCK